MAKEKSIKTENKTVSTTQIESVPPEKKEDEDNSQTKDNILQEYSALVEKKSRALNAALECLDILEKRFVARGRDIIVLREKYHKKKKELQEMLK